ncbi:unnamed protein product, partial [Urochloa humidicola]
VHARPASSRRRAVLRHAPTSAAITPRPCPLAAPRHAADVAPASPRPELPTAASSSPHCSSVLIVLAPLLAVLATAPPAHGRQRRGLIFSSEPSSSFLLLLLLPPLEAGSIAKLDLLSPAGQIRRSPSTESKSPPSGPPQPSQLPPPPSLSQRHVLCGREFQILRPPLPPAVESGFTVKLHPCPSPSAQSSATCSTPLPKPPCLIQPLLS